MSQYSVQAHRESIVNTELHETILDEFLSSQQQNGTNLQEIKEQALMLL